MQNVRLKPIRSDQRRCLMFTHFKFCSSLLNTKSAIFIFSTIAIFPSAVFAHEIVQLTSQGNRERRPAENLRNHTVIQTPGKEELVPANVTPIAGSQISVIVKGNQRILKSNGIAEHNTGRFPNDNNPNPIREQDYSYHIPVKPQLASEITKEGFVFGIAVNGVLFDPEAAAYYKGDSSLGWRYNALSGAIKFGLDENYAHVQPRGVYHYHNLPTQVLEDINLSPEKHSSLIGWAADGFPIYAMYGYQDGNAANSEIVEMASSYRLKKGDRPGGNEPGGYYDGTFLADYEYVDGLGTLDECNGRMTITPDFPDGTYAYFLTEDFPNIPRCLKGKPSEDFAKGGSRR